MADLKQERFQVRAHSHHKRSYLKASSRRVACAVFLLGLVLPSFGIATAQQESSTQRKVDLEIQKLELEVAKLQEEVKPLPSWLTGVLGLLASFLAGAATVLAARRARRGALDQSVHDKRLESYPELVKATERLAVYFPIGRPLTPLGPTECDAMGRAMSHWYFGGGGLLMSVKTRNAYFRLARALTRASLAKELRVPTFPKDAEHISVQNLKHYQKELKKHFRLNFNHVEGWRFGGPGSENERLSHRFKDYVFLQRLSSALRTRLSEDLRSRRRPS
jgi:hypothetical protein